MRKSALLLGAGGVLLLAAAAAVRFTVLPQVHQVPATLDTTIHYSGTATMLNAAALANGDLAHAFATGVPVTAVQEVKVTAIHDTTAVMPSAVVVTGADKSTLLGSQHVYALDRVTLEAVTPPAGSEAEPATGLVLGFPLTPKAIDYQYWDTTTQAATPAKYTRAETHAGRDTFVYIVKASGPVKDPKTLAVLPANLPKAALAGLATALPAAQQEMLAPLLPQLPDSLPLSYTSVTDTTFWVDTATGSVLETQQKQTITAALSGPTGSLPLAAVVDLNLKTADADVTSGAATAADAQRALTLIGVVTPLVLAVLGIALLLAIPLARRRVAAEPQPEPETPTPVS